MAIALRNPQATSRVVREFAIFGLLSAVFVALLVGVPHTNPDSFDRAILRDVQDIQWGAFSFIPQLGSDLGGGLYGAYIVPVVAALGFAITRNWRLLALLALVFVLHYVLISPKLFVTAYRPSPLFGVQGVGGLESFPSGHVQWAASFYGLLAITSVRAVQGRWRWAILATYALLVAGTMLGRMDLGRHWPVDVAGGLIMGFIALRLAHLAGEFMDRAQPALFRPRRVPPTSAE